MSVLKELEGRKYEIIFGSDVQRDGVYLELSDRTGETVEVIAEVFYYDEIGKVVFNCFREEIPYQLIKWLMDEAAKETGRYNRFDPSHNTSLKGTLRFAARPLARR